MVTISRNSRFGGKLRRLSFLPACLAGVLLAITPGCATFKKISPYPGGAPVQVSVEKKPLSKMKDLPVGVYYDQPHQLVVTGYQKGVMAGALLFGLVGVMVADSANKSAGTSRYSANAARMGADLTTLTHETLAEQLKAGAFPAIAGIITEGGQLQITPFAVFSVQKNGKARLHAMVRAELLGKAGEEPRWSVRYFARAPGEYMVEGTDSWAADNRYATGMKSALARTISVLLKDMQSSLIEKRKVKAKGIYPFLNKEIELPMIVLSESESELIARLAVGDVMTLAGTHVVDKADFTIKAAEFKTPQ